MSRGWRGLFAAALALAALLAQAQQAVPALSGPVVDQAHVFDATQAAALVQQLGALEQRTGAQVAVLTVDSTLPEDIADYTQRVADEWKLGRAQIGDGVLVVVAVKDRRARIAVAKTLEGAIPDLEARRIITQAMAPKFQSGDYAGGLQAGVARLAVLIQHEALPAPASAPAGRSSTPEDGAPWWLAALMGWVVGSSVLRAMFGRKLGALLTGGAAGGLAWFVTGSLLLGAGIAVVAGAVALVFGAASLLKGLGGGGLRRGGPVIFGSGLPGGGWNGGGGWRGGGGGGGWRSGGGGDFGGGGASGNW